MRIGYILLMMLMLANVAYGSYCFVTVYRDAPSGSHDYTAVSDFFEAMETVRTHYIHPEDATIPVLVENALSGMTEGLDPFSHYDPPSLVDYRRRLAADELCGIGIDFDLTEKGMEILAVSSNGSAEKSGVTAGDIILAINDFQLNDIDIQRCRELLIGDRNSVVNLTLLSATGKTRDVSIVRTTTVVDDIFGPYVSDSDVMVIRIGRIDGRSSSRLRRALETVREKRACGLVLDLRSSPGGNFKESVRMANMFLKPGIPIVSLTRNDENTPEIFSSDSEGYKETGLPLALLVDGRTASSSEIFSAALKGQKRALVFGETTYGKWVAQESFFLKNGGAVNISVASTNYFENEGGLTPDVVMPVSVADAKKILRQRIRHPGVVYPQTVDAVKDSTLEAAISHLTKASR